MLRNIMIAICTEYAEVFLDTGYVLALELSQDQNHLRAVEHWRQNAMALPVLVTTSYVFDEIVTYFNSRGHHEKAVNVGYMLLRSQAVKLVHVEEALFYESWEYFQQHRDKSYSLTDCVSFVVMRKFGIRKAYAFDRHFVQAGFSKEPE
jgi:uncharacterized protein